jgi:hypothetical protein
MSTPGGHPRECPLPSVLSEQPDKLSRLERNQVPEDALEEIQVLTIHGNKLFLPRDVRREFNLRNEDRVVVLNDNGRMIMRIIRKSKSKPA